MRIRMLFIILLLADVTWADQNLWPDQVAETKKNVPSVASLVDGLVQRLHEDPDDAAGWLLLARSFQHLDKPDDARLAYVRARALGRRDAALEQWLGSESAPDDDLAVVQQWLKDAEAGQ